ncbi:MAG: lamin tail domain-containing protein [Bacteroidia bacterium]|nr:lamin tail domain-containing protein [Bacteroidia bacterium]MCF8427669.1 lamin tail domain-containing protein [Bacteroidia bacterium]MCF8447079.1 lamin tail domain-containing protein [Bacteroidia bacterium]
MKKIYLLFFLAFSLAGNLKAQLIINEVLYDPSNTLLEGDANGDGLYNQTEDEFIEFVNTGSTALDVSGYQIWDDTAVGSQVYLIPSGIIIPPGGALVVFGGGKPVGLFGGSIVLADTGAGLSLNNTGEVIAIKDNLGKTILVFDSDALSNNPNESYTRSPDITGTFVQHATINTLKYSPGTKVNGSPFVTLSTYQVRFKLDLNNYPASFDAVYVKGNFNGYCDTCDALLDVNNDGLWELALPTSKDSLEYKFVVVSAGNKVEEDLNSSVACFSPFNSSYRFALVKSDTVLNAVCYNSCSSCNNYLQLKGVTDFITPAKGITGKAIHIFTDSIITNLSSYGIGIANNGNGSNGMEYRFPAISVAAGQNILVVRDSVALASYLGSCWSEFSIVLVDTTGGLNQNGNDAVELFKLGEVVETFGDINKDGTGEPWEYKGSWAFKTNTWVWTYGAINCTDSTTTIFDSECIYPICGDLKVSSIVVSATGGDSTITQNGGTLNMIATILPSNAGNKSVSWSLDDSTIASINSLGVLQAKADGDVIVKATAKDGSNVFGTKTILISGQATGIADLSSRKLTIYPNPFEQILNIESDGKAHEYKIYTLFGQLVDEGLIESKQKDLSKLSPGAYLMVVQVGDAFLSYKIFKK